MRTRDDWSAARSYWVGLGFIAGCCWAAFFIWIAGTGPS
jgi:hypothetical protein